MVLVDTSVLINYLRGRKTEGADKLSSLIENDEPFGINDFIYQELLQGAKDEKEFSLLDEYLNDLPFFSLKLGI